VWLLSLFLNLILSMKPIFRKLTNKYFLATVFFIVWMFFFDHNDIVLGFKRRQELHELRDKKEYYQERIKSTREELNQLKQNASSLEKVAREKYMMKKDNEDLFIIEEK
jgi:cell division protein DivIC